MTQEQLQPYIQFCHERLVKVGCTAAEAKELVRYAWNCPPKGIPRTDSLEGLVQAVERAPAIKDNLVDRARQTPEDRRRVVELARVHEVELPKANKYYPNPSALHDFTSHLRATLRDVWPSAEESRINGAILVSVTDGVDLYGRGCWKFSIENCDRVMRETEGSDGW